MIRLFVCDIDGCVAEPYRPFDLAGCEALASCAARASEATARPVVSLCSGRPYSYVEAVTQALGLTAPVLFESGGGRFDPQAARTTWHPDFTDALAEQVSTVRDWMAREVARPDTALSIDHGKRTQAGVVGPHREEVVEALPRVQRFVEEHAPGLRAFATDVSIDVLAGGLTKKQGLAWLAEGEGVSLAEVAYIGDTEGDIEALQAVGFPAAPANAEAEVRSAVRAAGGHVSDASVIEGTLEAYRACVARNERERAAESAASA